jgi:hypothetical protein
MNFLQLVQSAVQECGISTYTPSTTVGQPLEIKRVVDWINATYRDLHTLHADWDWLRQPFSFQTVATQQSYTPTQANIPVDANGNSYLGNWKRDSFRIYSQALGYSNEMIFPFLAYGNFRDLYQFGGMRTTNRRPDAWSIDPQKNLVLGPTPDDVYVVNGEYYRLPAPLAVDADVPLLPSQYHDLLVFGVMRRYGEFESQGDVFSRGDAEYTAMLRRLEADQLPTITWGAPLA